VRTEIIIDHDPGESSTVADLYGVLVGRVVDLDLDLTGSGYPAKDVYVVRVDEDGDLVVCERDAWGEPIENATWAIPQDAILRVRVAVGSFA
jgi:hypothetical protein